jgi:uncharacterized protein YukJ
MPIRSYSVLKGRPVVGEIRSSGRNQPHYHIRLDAGGESFDIAVNVQSVDGSEVLYHVEHDFHPPDPQGLIALPDGFTPLAQRGDRTAHHPLALDFVREGLVHRGQMHPLEIGVRSVQNDLENEVDDLTHRIDPNPDAKLYAFGSRFPGGIHDIHMNQGNPRGAFGGDNGIYQDGALFVHLPSQNRWLAVFIAFRTQSWDTDDRGNPISAPGREAGDEPEGRRAGGPPEDEDRARPPAPDDARRPPRGHAHGRHRHH